MFEVVLPTGSAATRLRWLDRHQLAGVLQRSVGEVERLVTAGEIDRLGLRRSWAFDPQAAADLVDRDVKEQRLSPLSIHVLRLLLEERLEIPADCFDGDVPPSLIRLLDHDFAVRSAAHRSVRSGLTEQHTTASIETKASNESGECTDPGEAIV